MLIKYFYVMKNNVFCGPYECDEADFKNFMKYVRMEEIYMLTVHHKTQKKDAEASVIQKSNKSLD